MLCALKNIYLGVRCIWVQSRRLWSRTISPAQLMMAQPHAIPFYYYTLSAAAAERIKIYNIALNARGWENNLLLEQWSGKKSFSLSRWSLWERFLLAIQKESHRRRLSTTSEPNQVVGYENFQQHQVASWINVKREIVKIIKIGSAPANKAKELCWCCTMQIMWKQNSNRKLK